MSVTACVKTLNGIPQLFIHNTPLEGAAYMTYLTERSHYADFAKMGYRLFSIPVFFATHSVNAGAQNPPFAKGIFDDENAPDFSKFDSDVASIVKASPTAAILPRVNVTLPFRWCDENSAELCDFGYHGLRWPCFASDKWMAEVKRYTEKLIDHVEASPYRDNIVGYQLSTGWTEEWICPSSTAI